MKDKNNKVSTTEEHFDFVTSSLENVDDPRFIANIAIGAIMVLVKKLMCGEDKD